MFENINLFKKRISMVVTNLKIRELSDKIEKTVREIREKFGHFAKFCGKLKMLVVKNFIHHIYAVLILLQKS